MKPIEPASKTVIVIPAYNEATSVGIVIANVRRALPSLDVVVIDDGSTDGTGAAAVAAGARCLRTRTTRATGHPPRRLFAISTPNTSSSSMPTDSTRPR